MTFLRGSDLFPALNPNATGMLDVGEGHEIYWEDCGNPKGVPIMFVHGGPGAGTASIHRRFFDPSHYRIILWDQRGCGRSRPLAETAANTTDHLISDMEAIRDMLGIERWILMGGSWGSTLSLAYGVAHPERCLGFILRGVFLGQDYECDWFLNHMGTFQPEAARAFIDFLPEDERERPLENYHARLMDDDPDVHLPAARAWATYEERCATLMPQKTVCAPKTISTLCLSRLEVHFFANGFFLKERSLLDEVSKISHLPCMIVQGRYDLVCPPVTADKLHRRWPGSQYVVVPDAGHSALDNGVRTALINATQAFKSI